MKAIVGNISYGIGWGLIFLAKGIIMARNFLVISLLMSILLAVFIATSTAFFMLLARLSGGIVSSPRQPIVDFIVLIIDNTKWYWELLVLVIGSLTMYKGFITALPDID